MCWRIGKPCVDDNRAYNRAVDSDPKDSLAESATANARDLPSGRVLGLDVGARRIGIAVSDPLGITAQGLETLQRRNKRHDFEQLQRIIQEYDVREIVVGLPLRMSGAEGIQSDKMQIFAEDLRKRFRLPVHLWDERLTTTQAHRHLDDAGHAAVGRKGIIDQVAAVLILQSFLEARANERDRT